jgi:hypothetical protein
VSGDGSVVVWISAWFSVWHFGVAYCIMRAWRCLISHDDFSLHVSWRLSKASLRPSRTICCIGVRTHGFRMLPTIYATVYGAV